MRELPLVTVRLFTPLPERAPLDICSFYPWQTAVVLTQARPLGFTGATVGFAEMTVAGSQGQGRGFPYLPQPVYVRDLAHCEIYAGAQQIFEGRVIEQDAQGSYTNQLRVEGYATQALGDQVWQPTSYQGDTTVYTAGRLLRQALADVCPFVPPPALADFTDTGALHTYSEVSGKTPAAIAQQFGTEGDGTALYDLMLWERRRCVFAPRVAPQYPTYREDVDGNVTIQRTTGDLTGSVYVRYTDVLSANTAKVAGPFTDPTFSTRFSGLSRSVSVSAGSISDSNATTYGATYLAKYRRPTYRVQLKRDTWRGLRLPSGGFRSPWFVRADEWVQVGDLPILPIVRIDCNLSTGQTTLQLGDPPLNILTLVQQTHAVAQAVVAGRNPNTGASS